MSVGLSFAETAETAPEYNSLADVKKTLIVLLLYGSIWSIGLIGILGCTINYRWVVKVDEEPKWKMRSLVAQQSRSQKEIQNYIVSYVSDVFPAVFHSKSSALRLWDEIIRHHRYLTIFRVEENDLAHERKVLTVIQLLTVQSMLFFVLCVCYDLQVRVLIIDVFPLPSLNIMSIVDAHLSALCIVRLVSLQQREL